MVRRSSVGGGCGTQGAGVARGTAADTTVPSPGVDSTVSVPPSWRARTRMAGSPWPRSRPVSGVRGRSGSKPRPLSAMSSEIWSSSQVRVSAARVARRVRVRWPARPGRCAAARPRPVPAAGPASPSSRKPTVSPSPHSRSASARSASARVRSARSAGARSWTNRRASARLRDAIPAASRMCARAASGSVPQVRSAAWSSICWLDRPCARVSWISWPAAAVPRGCPPAARWRPDRGGCGPGRRSGRAAGPPGAADGPGRRWRRRRWPAGRSPHSG